MPAMVGGFGIEKNIRVILFFDYFNSFFSSSSLITLMRFFTLHEQKDNIISFNLGYNLNREHLGSYLAGLIEGDGTFAIHDVNSTAKKYNPMIIICFKLADYPLACFLQKITQCGQVYKKRDRGYVLWQIHRITDVYLLVNLINGYMRTPKIEALHRTISWINKYYNKNLTSKLNSTKEIISKINIINEQGLDNSPINSNAWLAGFSDADSNFSINIYKRKNKISTRVQLFFRIEIKQIYSQSCNTNKSFFEIMSQISCYLKTNLLSRTRLINNKQYSSFFVMAASKNSIKLAIEYFKVFPLLSSKNLDYLDWVEIFDLWCSNSKIASYLDKAIATRKDFNKTRKTFTWDHLKTCYLFNKE